MPATLEHVNFTVPDPKKTAAWLCEVFDWHIRWSGDAIHGGHTVHVGSDDDYLAVYSGPQGKPQASPHESYNQVGGFNHVGITVDDLDKIEARVKAQGFATHSRADYEPGRRFYFHDGDGVEYEVVSYA